MNKFYVALVLLGIVVAGAGYLLYRSPPVPPMRTADQRQIERETAEIQGDADWWKNPILAISAVVACMFIAALVVPK